MKALALALMTVVLAIPAAAQDLPLSERTGVARVLGLTPRTEDFVRAVAVGNRFMIEAGKLAQQKADRRSKAFADKIIADNQKLSADLEALVSSGIVKVELPNTLDSRSERKLNNLRKLTGNNFDLKYDKGQVAANREAVSLLERYARGGQHPDLKVFAGKALPVARENLRMARNLRR
jgi:putative membrane protein